MCGASSSPGLLHAPGYEHLSSNLWRNKRLYVSIYVDMYYIFTIFAWTISMGTTLFHVPWTIRDCEYYSNEYTESGK